ncbi:hypothetical protein [Naumannella huperziae]
MSGQRSDTECRGTHEWVSAAPFRAHLADLVGTTGLPWRAVALYADVPTRCVRSLLFGRRGRVVRRIPARVAERLLRVRAAQLNGLTARSGDAWAAHDLASRLAGRGRSAAEIALLARATRDEAALWLVGPPGWVSARSVLLLQAACHAAGMDWAGPADPWEPSPAEAAA